MSCDSDIMIPFNVIFPRDPEINREFNIGIDDLGSKDRSRNRLGHVNLKIDGEAPDERAR